MENIKNIPLHEKLDPKIPEGPLAEKWTNYKNNQHLVNPANKRRLDIIVVGTGLAGLCGRHHWPKWASMYTTLSKTRLMKRTLW